MQIDPETFTEQYEHVLSIPKRLMAYVAKNAPELVEGVPRASQGVIVRKANGSIPSWGEIVGYPDYFEIWQNEITFTELDRDNDRSTLTLPTTFISDFEKAADEFIQAQRILLNRAAEAEADRIERANDVAREQRRRQYEALRQEFGHIDA